MRQDPEDNTRVGRGGWDEAYDGDIVGDIVLHMLLVGCRILILGYGSGEAYWTLGLEILMYLEDGVILVCLALEMGKEQNL